MDSIPDLNDFQRIVFFTGAGISAESGIPTYRGKGGIWGDYNYEEYACQRAFDRDPEKVWEFHEKRRKFMSECNPALGHKIIADIEKAKPGTTVVTQNIDGMHQRAGNENVLELHGSIWRVRCDRDGTVEENFDVPFEDKRCPICGDYLRPDIVWFEDGLNVDVINNAIRAVINCDLLITIGTSAMVFPAAEIPVIAIQKQIPSIEINLESTPLTPHYQHFMQGSAGEMLRLLWD